MLCVVVSGCRSCLLFPNAHTSQGEMLSMKLIMLSLESRRTLKRWELTSLILLCQRSVGTCNAHGAVVFLEDSEVGGVRTKLRSEEKIA